MAVAQAAAPTRTNGTTGANTSAYAAGYTPSAGHLLLLTVSAVISTTATPPTISTPSGWTLLGSAGGANGTVSCRLSVFGRWATGSGDSAPSVTISGVTTSQAQTEAWSGLDSTAALPLQPAAPLTGTTTTSTTTVTSNNFTTSVANEWVFSAFGARGPSGMTFTSWTGGTSADGALTQNSFGYIATGTQTVVTSGTSVTPVLTHSSASGGVGAVMSFGFKPPGAAPTTNPSAMLIAS